MIFKGFMDKSCFSRNPTKIKRKIEEMYKNDNISQRMALIESDIDVILRNNGKGNYFLGKKYLCNIYSSYLYVRKSKAISSF